MIPSTSRQRRVDPQQRRDVDQLRRTATTWVWAWVLGTFLSASVATAHPFDETYHSARAALVAKGESVELQVIVEIPTMMILEEFLAHYGDPTQLDEGADEIFRQRQFERLAEQLRLRLDGRVAKGLWRPWESEANGRGTEKFFIYILQWVPEDPSAMQRKSLKIQLDLEVFPRDFIYLSSSAEVEPPWTLIEDSAEKVLAQADEELFDPETGRWSVDPRLRRLKWILDRATP